MAVPEAMPESYNYDDSAIVPAHGSEIGRRAINDETEEIGLPDDLPEPPGKTAFEELAPSSGPENYITFNTSVYGTGTARVSDKDADMDDPDDR